MKINKRISLLIAIIFIFSLLIPQKSIILAEENTTSIEKLRIVVNNVFNLSSAGIKDSIEINNIEQGDILLNDKIKIEISDYADPNQTVTLSTYYTVTQSVYEGTYLEDSHKLYIYIPNNKSADQSSSFGALTYKKANIKLTFYGDGELSGQNCTITSEPEIKTVSPISEGDIQVYNYANANDKIILTGLPKGYTVYAYTYKWAYDEDTKEDDTDGKYKKTLLNTTKITQTDITIPTTLSISQIDMTKYHNGLDNIPTVIGDFNYANYKNKIYLTVRDSVYSMSDEMIMTFESEPIIDLKSLKQDNKILATAINNYYTTADEVNVPDDWRSIGDIINIYRVRTEAEKTANKSFVSFVNDTNEYIKIGTTTVKKVLIVNTTPKQYKTEDASKIKIAQFMPDISNKVDGKTIKTKSIVAGDVYMTVSRATYLESLPISLSFAEEQTAPELKTDQVLTINNSGGTDLLLVYGLESGGTNGGYDGIEFDVNYAVNKKKTYNLKVAKSSTCIIANIAKGQLNSEGGQLELKLTNTKKHTLKIEDSNGDLIDKTTIIKYNDETKAIGIGKWWD